MAKKKKPSKPAGAKKASTVPTVPSDQWEMPATFAADGKNFASLKELVDPQVPTMSLSQLTERQRADLVAKRIALQPKFNLAMVGAGVIDKKRAIAEVKARSRVGKTLIEIEQRLLNDFVNRAKKK